MKFPFGTSLNYGIWFDRDGVDSTQATFWGAVDGGTYNTGGVYDMVISYHAIGPNLGSMCPTVNAIQTGFYTDGWKNAQPEIYPAGLSFKGNMTKMQTFAGLWAMAGVGGDVVLSDITVTGCLSTVVIDGCDTGVLDQLYDGELISEGIEECAKGAEKHEEFVSCVAELTNALKKDGTISGKEKGAIQSCAAQADIPADGGGSIL